MADIRRASIEPGSVERLPGPLAQSGPFAALPILLGALMCVLLLTTQIGLRRNAPRGALRAPSIRVALAGEYLGAIVCCAAQTATATSGRLLWPALALICAATLAVLAYTFVVLGRAPREPLRNPAAWRGIFYFDRDDPALFVPKRVGLGYTFNFGHPGAIALAFVLLLVPLLATAAAILAR